jgi:two-component SAPR family response regulator
MWRLRAQRLDLVQATQGDLGLSPEVWVDARALERAAEEFRRSGRLPDPGALMQLRGELLPGHWDTWLVFDRERLRHEAIHLLESACEACLRLGDAHAAMLLALCAVECDPLRESANLFMIKAHLASGDAIGAIRRARSYARMLSDELGIAAPDLIDERLLRPAAPARYSLREAERRAVGVAG